MKKVKHELVASTRWCCRTRAQRDKEHAEWEKALASGEIVLPEPKKKRPRITCQRRWELELKKWLDSQYFG